MWKNTEQKDSKYEVFKQLEAVEGMLFGINIEQKEVAR